MPLSMPETAETVATATASVSSPNWAASPWGMPKSLFSPTLRPTTPMPSEVATPKIVPSTAAMSTPCPMGPLIRLPNKG